MAETTRNILEPGTVVDHNGHPFVILGEEQGGLLAIAAEMLDIEMPFDENGMGNWTCCSLRAYLNGEYLAELGGSDGLMEFNSDLTAADGTTDFGTSRDFVFLLSDALYQKYENIIPRYETGYWTVTPSMSGPGARYADFVAAPGEVTNILFTCCPNIGPRAVRGSHGVVPCVLLDAWGRYKKTLRLSSEEARIFFEIVDSELRCLINEYDSDTGRKPGAKRMKGLNAIKSVMDRFITEQPTSPMGLILLDSIHACSIDIDVKEAGYIKPILQRWISTGKVKGASYDFLALARMYAKNSCQVLEKIKKLKD